MESGSATSARRTGSLANRPARRAANESRGLAESPRPGPAKLGRIRDVSHASPTLADEIDAALPQTQCRRCGHDGCRPYAEADRRRRADQPLPARRGRARSRRSRRSPDAAPSRSTGACGEPGPLTVARIDEARVHRLHAVHRRLPRRRDRRRREAHAHGAARACAPGASCAFRPAPSTASRWCRPAARGAAEDARAARERHVARSRRRAQAERVARARSPPRAARRRRAGQARGRDRGGARPRPGPPRAWRAGRK